MKVGPLPRPDGRFVATNGGALFVVQPDGPAAHAGRRLLPQREPKVLAGPCRGRIGTVAAPSCTAV